MLTEHDLIESLAEALRSRFTGFEMSRVALEATQLELPCGEGLSKKECVRAALQGKSRIRVAEISRDIGRHTQNFNLEELGLPVLEDSRRPRLPKSPGATWPSASETISEASPMSQAWWARASRRLGAWRTASSLASRWQRKLISTWFVSQVTGTWSGTTPREVLQTFKPMQMADVHLPTTDGRELILSRNTQPGASVQGAA